MLLKGKSNSDQRLLFWMDGCMVEQTDLGTEKLGIEPAQLSWAWALAELGNN